MKKVSFRDSLYGDVIFNEEISALVASPIVQRLRHVRLSNIDSLNMPGIANLSRYEHVLGVGHLACQLGLYNRLSHSEKVLVVASALLHDWAITSFGHLVEEAFQYADTGFDHEKKFYEIIMGEAQEEIGGVERQIYLGRQTALLKWARLVDGIERAEELLMNITENVRGHGQFGQLICGDIDLDNIDSVFRIAYHMGLPADRECPLRLAHSIIDVAKDDGKPVFLRSAEPDITQWLSIRYAVYERLMLASADFAGKLMLLYATVSAIEMGEIDKPDWNLSDNELLAHFLESKLEVGEIDKPDRNLSDNELLAHFFEPKAGQTKATVIRWLAGELWNTTPLYWMAGERPEFPRMLSFSKELSVALSRPCFGYCIRDKRDRLLRVRFKDSGTEEFGNQSLQWLFGLGSPKRSPFTAAETGAAIKLAQTYFNTSVISAADQPGSSEQAKDNNQQCLL